MGKFGSIPACSSYGEGERSATFSQPIPWSNQRLLVVEFLINSAQLLEVTPIVKYSALSLFPDKFRSSLSRFLQRGQLEHWLLQQPITDTSLQLFSLVSIWISSKMHDSRPFSLKSLKSLADISIDEQHFTARDFVEAELLFMQVLDFEIGTSNVTFLFVEELWIQLKEVAKIGELIKLEACMEIMDLLYEKEETSALFRWPHFLAASILVASYVITVPRQDLEFPVLYWATYEESYDDSEICILIQRRNYHRDGDGHSQACVGAYSLVLAGIGMHRNLHFITGKIAEGLGIESYAILARALIKLILSNFKSCLGVLGGDRSGDVCLSKKFSAELFERCKQYDFMF